MIFTRLNVRGEEPAFFDMACRFMPRALPAEERRGLNIAERCVAYAYLETWRALNPRRRLTIVDDPFLPGGEEARDLPARWLFGRIADEIVETSFPEEELPAPAGEALFQGDLWELWNGLQAAGWPVPEIAVDPEAQASAANKKKLYGVPAGPYLTMQPHRRATRGRWLQIAEALAKLIPVVILGPARNAARTDAFLPANIYPLWLQELDVMETLALIAGGQLHVGGETGTTLWAPVLRTPTAALYPDTLPFPEGHWGTRPISFGQPVALLPFGLEPERAAAIIAELYYR